MNIQRAIIFSAGLGTRFKPWTDRHPKALALVNGKSLLQRNIEYLQRYGIYEVVVNVHHFADQIIHAVDENQGWGSGITISDEKDKVLETGGGLLHAKHLLDFGKPFLSLNVDVLTDLDLTRLVSFHAERKPLVSFAVSKRATSRNLLLNDEGRLCGWRNNSTAEEKIVIDEVNLQPFAYNCVVIYQPEIFSVIRQTGKFSIMDTYLDLAPEHLIYGYEQEAGRWVDVGKPQSVAVAEAMFP